MLPWAGHFVVLAALTGTYEQSIGRDSGASPSGAIESFVADALGKARPGAFADPRLSAACAELLSGEQLAGADFDHFRYLLWRQGVGDTVLLPYRGKFENEIRAKTAMKGVVAQLVASPFNRWGIATRVDEMKRVEVAIVVLQRDVGFAPIARVVPPGAKLDVTVVTASPRDVRVLLQEPQGTTTEHAIGRVEGTSQPLVLALGSDAGRYDVEIVFLEESGPYITASFPVYVGQEFPEKFVAPVYEVEAGKIPEAEIEARLAKLVNETRARYKLEPLRTDATLARMAREHSADMRKSGFGRSSAAHGTLTKRLDRAGIWFRDATEVIGAGVSARAIHASLMSSPAHRIVLLDSRLRDLGVGIAVVKPQQAYATEILASIVPKVDTAAAAMRVLELANEKRVAGGLSALDADAALASIAASHARAMAASGSLAYEVPAQKKGAKPASLFDAAKKAAPGAKALGGFVGVIETVENPVEHDAMFDAQMTKAGVGIFQASSPEYGAGALWIAVVVAR